jgi:fibronectin-binding autotransporter adhesin
MLTRKLQAGVVIALAVASVSLSARAAVIDWSSTAGTTSWSTGSNWVGGNAPTNNLTTDIARFNQTSYLSLPDVGTTSVNGIQIGDGTTATAGLTISGAQLNLGNGGISMYANAGAVTLSAPVALMANQSWTNNAANNLTVSGLISGAFNLTKAGTGRLILSNSSNSYSGTTTITNGVLEISSDANLGAAPGTATANKLVIDTNGTLAVTSTMTLNSNRGIAVGPTSGIGAGTIDVGTGAILTYGGIITSNGGSGTGALTKIGNGTLVLSGANTYTGNTTVSTGTLKLGSTTALPYGLGKGNLAVASTLDLNNNSATVNGLSGAGIITSSTAGAITFTAGANNQTSTFTGTIQNGSGTVALAKTGTGILTLGGNNTYTGGVTILGGAMQLGHIGALNSSTPNSVAFGPSAAVGTKLQLNGNSVTISSLATNATPGTVVVENANAVAATLTVNQSTNTTFAGVIQNGTGGGALSLTKSGTGSLTLSGTNTYTGTTTISNGSLQMGSALSVPSGTGTGNVVLDGGAAAGVLDINGFDLTINGLSGVTGAVKGSVVNNRTATTKTLTVGSGDASTTFAGLLQDHTTGTGVLNLTKTGTGTLTLTNANTYTGTTAIKNGSIILGVANALTATTSLTLGDGTTHANGSLKLNGYAQTLAGLTTAGSGSTNSVINGSATAINLTLNIASSSTFAGILGGVGTNDNNFNLIKTGAGTMTLSGANTFTGTTTISQGTLSVGNLANALGSNATAVVLGDASNTGTLAYTGTSSTFTRGLTVSAGGGEFDTTTSGQTLSLTTANVTGTGAFTIGGAGNTSITSNITNTSSLNKTGAGSLTLSGVNTYSGATNIKNGTIILAVNDTGLNSTTTLTLGDATANTNGVLKLDGRTQTLAGLTIAGSGTGNRVVGGNAALSTLTLGTSNFAGILGGPGTNENNLALLKSGAGTLTLSGTNTYTGGTTISGGVLAVSANANLGAASNVLNIGAGSLQVTSNFTATRGINLTDATSALVVDTGITYTHSGAITGTGALNLTSPGTLLVSGATKDYSGGTNIKNGTLTLGAADVLPANTVLTLGSGVNNGTLKLNAFNQTLAGITTSGTGTTSRVVNGKVTAAVLTINNTSDYTYSGILGGPGTNENAFALTKSGAGKLTLSGTNTYTGNTVISAGTLALGSANVSIPTGAGNGNVQVDGTLDVNGRSPTINGLTGSGYILNNGATGQAISVGNNDQTSTFAGIVRDGTGTLALTKVGTGILTLSNANTYTGATTVTLGTIKIANANALPSGIGKGNVSLTGSLDLNGYSITLNGLSGAGGISSTTTGTLTLSVGANDQVGNYSGIISNGTATSIALTKIGTNILTLSGANTYTGDTTISAGTLKLGGNNAIPSGASKGNVVIATNATLDINGRTAANGTINGLTGTGTVTNTSNTTGLITIGGNNATSTFNGNIQDGGTGAKLVTLVKTGTGTLTLTPGTDNAFTGGVTINGGVVQAGNANALNSAGTNVVTFASNVAVGTKLQINGYAITIAGLASGTTTGSPVVENANATNGTLTINNSVNYTYAGVIQDGTGGGALALVKTGAGTEILTGTSLYTGGTTINGGIVAISKDAALGNTSGQLTIGNGKLQATATIASTPRNIALNHANATIIVDTGFTYTEAGVISGSGTLNKEGKGVFQITGTANDYSGGTIITAGMVDVTGTTGTPLGQNVNGNNITVNAGGNLSLSSTNNKGANQTITVNSSGSGLGGIGFSNTALTQAQLSGMFTDSTGSYGGVLSINNAISYNSAINLATFGTGAGQGYWFLGSGSTGTFSGAAANLTVGAGSTYRLGGGGGTLTISATNVLTGSNEVLVGSGLTNGNGSVILTNAQNYTGKTTVTGGAILSIGSDGSLGTAPGTPTAGRIVLDGGTLQFRAATTLNANRGIALGTSGAGTLDTNGNSVGYAGIIADNGGAGTLTKIGTGTLTLTGQASTYTGATNINAGTINFSGIRDLGQGTAINFNGGTLQYAAGNTTDITVRTITTTANGGATIDTNGNDVTFGTSAITGTGLFTKTGAGTLTMNVANSYNGNTTITAGTIKLGNVAAIPSGSGKGTLTVTGTLDLNNLSPTVNLLAGAGTVTNSQTGAVALTVDTANVAAGSTFSGNLNNGSGTTSLIKVGANTLTLSGSASTYSGGTTINLGTLSITSDAALGSVPGTVTPGSITIAGGASLGTTTNDVTIASNRGITLGTSGSTAVSIAVAAGKTLTYNGILANGGSATSGLTKTNTTGTLVLGGVNSYAGDTTVSGGTLKVANTNAIPFGTGKGNVSLASTSGGNLDLNGYTIVVNGLSGAGAITSSVAGAAGITAGANDQTSSYSGAISNGSGTVSLGKTGTGTLTLSGTSTYTGGTTISNGVLSIGADANLGANSAANTLAIAGGTLQVTNSITLGSTRGIVVGPASGSGTGTIEVSTGKTVTYNGTIANNGSGTGGLTKTNTTGALVLGGANTYSGDTTINGGTLQLTNVAAIPSGTGKGNLTLGAGSTLDLNNLSPTINGLSGSGSVTNSQTGSVTLTAGGNDATSSYSGVIQDGNGTVALTKIGNGTLTLSGANTYSGNTTVSTGTLEVNNVAALPSGAGKGNVIVNGTLDMDTSLTVNGLSGSGLISTDTVGTVTLTAGANDQTSNFAGNIRNGTGTMALTKTGMGTLTLSGDNRYSGATTISTGTLAMGSTTGLSGNSTVTISGPGTLDVNGYSVTMDGLLGTGTINNNGASPATLTAGAAGGSSTFGGVIADGTNTLALTKSGSGVLTLTGVNTYSGTTTIANGTISVANPGVGGNLGTAASAVVLGAAGTKGTLSYTGSSDLNFTRGFDVQAGGGEVDVTTSGKLLTLQTGNITAAGTFTVGGAGNASLQSVISGNGGFTKANTGTMVVSSTNTYSGDTTISTGTMQLTNSAAIPSGTGKGNVIVNGTLDVNNLNITINGLSGSGTVTNSQGSPVTLTMGDNNASGNFTGVLQDGAGTMALTKIGSGLITLGGANTYSGNTTISAGTLQIGNAAALPSGAYKGNVALAAQGTLDLNDYDLTINGLTGAGLVTNNSGASTLSVGANDQTAVFTGSIRDGLGTIGLTKTGTGTLTLSGNNTFSGATTISQGVVSMGSDTGLSAHSTLTIANAGTLDLNGRVIAIDGLAGTGSIINNSATPVTLTTGSSGGSGTFGGTINDGTGTIALAKTGAGTVTLTNVNGYSGGTTITGGTLAVTSDGALGAVPGVTTAGNLVLNGGTLSADNTFELNSKRGIVVGPSSGTGFGGLGAAANQTLTYAGVITNNGAGSGGLTTSGAGTVTLANANTYTGDTIVASGSLQVAYPNAIPTGTGKGNVTVNGALDLNNYDVAINGLSGSGTVTNTRTGAATFSVGNNNQTSTFDGVIENGVGTVNLTKAGSGTLTLTGNNTYTGTTNIDGGTLALGGSGVLGPSGTINFNGGILQYSASNNLDYSARFSNASNQAYNLDTKGQNVTLATTFNSTAGTLTKLGAGTLTITNTNGYTGTTTITAGTLQIGNGVTDGSITASSNIVDNAALIYNLAGNQTNAKQISGSGTVTKTGAGKLTMSGTNTYAGTTTVNNGTLVVNGTLATGGAAVTVAAGATLAGHGIIDRTVSLAGAVSPGDNATEVLTTGSFDMNSGATFNWEHNGLAPTKSDLVKLQAGGVLNFGGTWTLNLVQIDGTPLPNLLVRNYIFDTSDAIKSIVNFDPNNVTVNYVGQWTGLQVRVLKAEQPDENGRTGVYIIAVPEPCTLSLLGLGASALLLRRRRRIA